MIQQSKTIRISSVVTVALFLLSTVGCYNTYRVDRDEFAKLQRKPDDTNVVTITDVEKKQVAVEESTSLYVRSTGGRRYPVTPFNFRISQTQLVASDRDTLLAVNGIESYEVDHLSTWKTVLLASGGAAVAAGVILAIIFTSGQKTFD
jgi:hypothetical protein